MTTQMDPTIDRMLNLTADIAEELLLIKDSGRNCLSDGLKLKIISLAEIAATTGSCQPDEMPSTTEEVSATEAEVPAEEVGEPEAEEPVEEVKPDGTTLPAEEEQETEPVEDGVVEERPSESGAAPEVMEVPEENPALTEADCVVFEEESEDVVFEVVEDDPDGDDTETDADDCAGDVVDVAEVVDNHQAEPETEIETEAETETETAFTGRRLDIADIYHTFSINDVYLYRREIFGGSQARFLDALDRVSMLPDRHALQVYLVEQLNLNLNESPGKDFYQSLAVFF